MSFTDNTTGRYEWETPPDFFTELDKEFGFTLDVCATKENAKCQNFYTKETNGLAQEWKGICWMNPPYGDAQKPCRSNCNKKRCQVTGHVREYVPGISDWMKKARESAATVVCLVPSRTDNKWWHRYVMMADEIRFVRGRLTFVGAPSSAKFASAVVIFRGNHD